MPRPLHHPAVRTLAAAFMFGFSVSPVHGQETTELLTGSAVTEDNVIAALEPTPLMRSFKRRAPGSSPDSGIGQPAVKPRSASLLITFETDSSVLTTAAAQQLDVVAGALRHGRLKGYSFEVEGHADPRGTADHNLALSRLRADAVQRYLVANQGIEPRRLVPVGKGDLEPLNQRDPAAPENRRVTFKTQPLAE